MKSLWHFFRLIRPLNLAVIALTMGVFQVFLSKYQESGNIREYYDYSIYQGIPKVSDASDSGIFQFDFLLLVLSTVLVAAAGNIINDYFDVKADRVNKPELLIIDKHIKRRWAILFNWIFNSVGLLIAMYLGWKLQNWFIAITPFVCINLLWFYSAFFKRRFFIGNVIVALLTALVPVYVLIFHLPIEDHSISLIMGIAVTYSPYQVIGLSLSIAFVAFFINLIREIIKDVADIKGDLLLHANTIPIKWGIKRTKIILVILLLPLLLSIVMYAYFAITFTSLLMPTLPGFHFTLEGDPGVLLIFVLASVSLLLTLVSYAFLLMTNTRRHYLLSSNLLKLAMFFGLLTPLFL